MSPGRGRSRARWALAALLASLALVGAGCGSPVDTSPVELAAEAEAFDGRDVTVQGSVVAFDADDGASRPHVVLEDEDANRIELLPTDEMLPYAGSAVEVTGTFEFATDQGRRILVEDVTELAASE